MKSELLLFLTQSLDEQSNFKRVRHVAEKAIRFGMNKSAEEKEQWVFSALTELCTLEDTTITTKKIILEAIEVIMLSRRISNTKAKNIFSSQIDGNSNHVWLLNGAQVLISGFYPSLNVEYTTISPRGADVSDIVERLKRDRAIWVIAGYEKNYHLSLVRLELIDDHIQIQLLDSLGINPTNLSSKFAVNLSRWLFSIISSFSLMTYSITSSSDRRQADGQNCFSFVLNDLEIAEHCLKAGVPYFFNTEKVASIPSRTHTRSLPLLPEFYGISQLQKANFSMPINQDEEALGNPLALNKSISSISGLIQQHLLTFRPERYIEDGASDVDEKINDCCIM